MSSLKTDLTKVIADTVNQPNVPANQDAVKPLTEAVMAEVQPRIDHLTSQEPWYLSRVVWGVVIVVISQIVKFTGHEIPPEYHGVIITELVRLGPAIGAALAFWGSRFSKKPIGQ